jgi:hypothetical protein
MAGGSGAKLVAVADQSFVDAMTTAAGVAAGVALAGALIALALLPSRARSGAEAPEAPQDALLAEPAAALAA